MYLQYILLRLILAEGQTEQNSYFMYTDVQSSHKTVLVKFTYKLTLSPLDKVNDQACTITNNSASV